MYQDAPARVQSILNELCTCGKMFEKVVVIDVVDLDDLVRVAGEQVLVQRQPQDRQHMGDAAVLQRLLAAQRKEASCSC